MTNSTLPLVFLHLIIINKTLGGGKVQHPQVNTPIESLTFTSEFTPANDEQRLLRYLFWSYDRAVRPVYNATHVVVVKVGLSLTHIFNIDEKKQVLSLNVWLEHEWRDERLGWEPGQFGNLTQLTVPARYMWLPDIVLYNNAEDFSQGIFQTNVAIYPNGEILWAPPVKFRSTCRLEVGFFPFDEQVCHLRFGSWIYEGTLVDIQNRSYSITTDSYTDHGEWAILGTSVNRKVSYYNCCGDGDTPFPELQFSLHLQRRTLFYMYNIIIPCIMLSVLTMMQFWLPCESGEKITLGLTVVLAYSVFSFNIAENMPETSDVIPLIAIYIMCIMGISSMSVGLSVIVLNLRHGSERRHRVPVWLSFLANRILAPLLCFDEREIAQVQSRFEQDIHVNKALSALSSYIVAVASDKDQEQEQPSPILPLATQNLSPSLSARSTLSPMQKRVNSMRECLPKPRRSSASANVGAAAFQEAVATAQLSDVIERTAVLMERFEKENMDEDIMSEWQRVARVFDQLFFWIVFCVTLASTLVMFVLGGKGKHMKDDIEWYPLSETSKGMVDVTDQYQHY